MNTDQLIKQVARHALDHGHLHLGEATLLDLICADLGVSKDELKQVEQHLKPAPIGAIATIQFDNEPEPIEGYYFSFGDYDEDTNSDSFGVNDHRVFYYAQGEADMVALSKPNGGDFVILSYELEFQP